MRTSLAEVMQILGPSYLHFLVSVLETALTKGYQLHICVYTVSYMVFALKVVVSSVQWYISSLGKDVLLVKHFYW